MFALAREHDNACLCESAWQTNGLNDCWTNRLSNIEADSKNNRLNNLLYTPVANSHFDTHITPYYASMATAYRVTSSGHQVLAASCQTTGDGRLPGSHRPEDRAQS